MNQIQETSEYNNLERDITTATTLETANPISKPPWKWYMPALMAFFFGIGGGALTAYINFKRLGKSGAETAVKLAIPIIIWLFIMISPIPHSVPSIVINLIVGLIFLLFQKSDFEEWSRNNPELQPAKWWNAIGWAIIGGIAYLVIVITILFMLDIPLYSLPRNLRPLK